MTNIENNWQIKKEIKLVKKYKKKNKKNHEK